MDALGILGGTFDPIHYGHLRTAEQVRTALGLPAVRLIPAGNPWHRDDRPPPAPRLDRLAMARLALEEFPALEVDPREAVSDAPSYTVDTLTSIGRELPRIPLLLLLGGDAFAGLLRWSRWRELFSLAHLVLVARPGFTLPDPLPSPLGAEYETRVTGDAHLLSSGAGRIYVQPVDPQPISATAIRALLRAGRRPEGLLPEAVIRYIEAHGLYRN
jgi:nicotinate-nucleotide adenylyltransferase